MNVVFFMQREPSVLGATLSKVYLDGSHLFDVVEDVVREVPGQPVASWKIYGVTAIPQGLYEITFENSKRFGPDTLTVNGVEGYTGVRIHGGNTAADTDGCLCPGNRNSRNTVAASQPALAKWKALVKAFKGQGHKVFIKIVNPL